MASKIEINEMASAITKLLTEYNEEVTEIAKEVVDDVAEQVMEETKSHITWKDKRYSKSFELTKSFEDKRNKRITWHVKSPHYRLTHLLEYGHITRDGVNSTRKFPHVRYGDEYLQNNFERIMKERIQQCKI